jgi:hypothetical protein
MLAARHLRVLVVTLFISFEVKSLVRIRWRRVVAALFCQRRLSNYLVSRSSWTCRGIFTMQVSLVVVCCL